MVARGARGLGIGGHHAPNKGANDEWLTPPSIVAAVGPFDLDPCSPVDRPWDTARHHLTIHDDGLTAPWGDAFVWCNPPYSTNERWLARLADHPPGGIALIFARTETAAFFRQVWQRATSILFLEGRLFFHLVTGERASHNSGAPSVLIGYGDQADTRLRFCGLPGAFVSGWTIPDAPLDRLDFEG